MGVNIGAGALLDINLIWFDCIARISQRGGGGYFTHSNDFYLPSLRKMKGGGARTLWKDPFHMHSKGPHLPQFQSSQLRPPLSGLWGTHRPACWASSRAGSLCVSVPKKTMTSFKLFVSTLCINWFRFTYTNMSPD